MRRQFHRETSAHPWPAAQPASPLPRCRVSSEFAAELGLDPIRDEASPATGELGALREGPPDVTNAPRSEAQPTLPPGVRAPTARHRGRLLKVSLLLVALGLVGGLSYSTGHRSGQVEGELGETGSPLIAVAEAAASSLVEEVRVGASALTRTRPLPSAPSTSVASGPTAPPRVLPTPVDTAAAEKEARVIILEEIEIGEASPRTEVAEGRRESRARRRARASSRTQPNAIEREPATESPAEVTLGASAAEASTESAPQRLPLDPLAGAIGAEHAARLGVAHAPPELEMQEIGQLPVAPTRLELSAAIHRILPAARRCGHEGRLSVSILVRPDGRVADSRVDTGGLPPEAEACVLSALRQARFAPFSGPELVLSAPMRL